MSKIAVLNDKFEKTSENRLPQRAFYIPEGEAVYTLLNGEWRFNYYANSDAVDVNAKINKDSLEININYDKELRTITISDNGCGMSESDL